MIENKIKDMILKQYGSVLSFSEKVKLPNSTIDSILKRGIENSNIKNVVKMCKALSIDIEELLINNKIVEKDYSNIDFKENIKLNEDYEVDIMSNNNIELTEDVKKALLEFIDSVNKDK